MNQSSIWKCRSSACQHEWQALKSKPCDWCGVDAPRLLGAAYSEKVDNVVLLDCITTLDLPASRVMDAAKREIGNGQFIISGWGEDGEFYLGSNFSDKGGLLLLLELAKKRII